MHHAKLLAFLAAVVVASPINPEVNSPYSGSSASSSAESFSGEHNGDGWSFGFEYGDGDENDRHHEHHGHHGHGQEPGHPGFPFPGFSNGPEGLKIPGFPGHPEFPFPGFPNRPKDPDHPGFPGFPGYPSLSEHTSSGFSKGSTYVPKPTSSSDATNSVSLEASPTLSTRYPSSTSSMQSRSSGISSSGASLTPTASAAPQHGCHVEPDGYGPRVEPDTAEAFLNYSVFHTVAQKATIPSGYNATFIDFKAQVSANNYMGLHTLNSYDVQGCAEYCNSTYTCTGFNIFIERDPSVNPAANCPNPPSVTNYKCTFWGSGVYAEEATNYGQNRYQFQIVVAGSNGYELTRPLPSSSSQVSSSTQSNTVHSSAPALVPTASQESTSTYGTSSTYLSIHPASSIPWTQVASFINTLSPIGQPNHPTTSLHSSHYAISTKKASSIASPARLTYTPYIFSNQPSFSTHKSTPVPSQHSIPIPYSTPSSYPSHHHHQHHHDDGRDNERQGFFHGGETFSSHTPEDDSVGNVKY